MRRDTPPGARCQPASFMDRVSQELERRLDPNAPPREGGFSIFGGRGGGGGTSGGAPSDGGQTGGKRNSNDQNKKKSGNQPGQPN